MTEKAEAVAKAKVTREGREPAGSAQSATATGTTPAAPVAAKAWPRP